LGELLFFQSKIIVPYVYPFIIRTIEGILKFNFGSIITSAIGIIIFVLTTFNSLLQIWQLIKDMLEKRKEEKQLNILSEIQTGNRKVN